MTKARVRILLFALIFSVVPAELICQVPIENSDSTQETGHRKFPIVGNGEVHAGYYYGLTPFISSFDGPIGYFQGDLNMQVNVKTLPFNVTGYYTSLHNVTGLNNSIHISFDSQVYKERLKNKAHIPTDGLKDSLNNLSAAKQKYTQRLYYLKYLQTLSPEQYQRRLEIDKLEAAAKDSMDAIAAENEDSLNEKKTDYKKPDFSLPQIQLPEGDNYKDSLNDIVNQQQEKLDSLNSFAKTIQQKINTADSLNRSSLPAADLPGAGFFSKVKTLQFGMCYPSLSPFLLSGIPLRGFSMEIERKGFYYAIAAGKTISNLLLTQNIIQDNLNNYRNLYNFFDFNNVQSGRSIVAIKAGRGAKDGTHLFAGLLYGRGLESYWQDSLAPPLNAAQSEKNWVAEIDGRFDLGKNHSLLLNYAKSVIKPISSDLENAETANLSWLNYKYRSNAIQTKYIGRFPKLHSSITASLRFVDPYFRSFGAGFVRQDNIRYEIKTDHQLGKKVRLGFTIRRDANNLLGLYDQFTVLKSAGITFKWKITSRFQIGAMYNPVFQEVKQDGEIIYTNNNQIANSSFTWRPRTGKWSTQVTGLYSYYKLFDGWMNREFGSALLSCSTRSKKNLSFNAQLNSFSVSPADTLLGNSLVYAAGAGYRWKKGFQLEMRIRYAETSLYGNQAGASCQIHIPIRKQMTLVIDGERLVPGDFYNSYTIEQFNRFPYFCSAQLVLNW
jgi:hypothetical protein